MSSDLAVAPFVDVDLPLPDRRVGKVRVSYALGDRHRLFVTTDRLSAFDRIVAGVRYKGQVLNQLAAWWFAETADVVANHVVALPDPNLLVAKAAAPLPVEVVVRGYITGVTSTSLWRQYADGARTIYGYDFPDGLAKNSALPEALITPTTKPPAGSTVHDEPLTCAEVIERGARRARTLGPGDRRRPRRVRPRPAGGGEGRPDPGRHQVRVRSRHRRRAAAHRRGPHARLVAVLGRRHVRRPAGAGRGTGEPRQGGRAPGAGRRRLRRRR